MNLKIISTNENEKTTFFDIFYRETIGRFLSSILFIGYILIFLTKEKKSIHDILSDTRVVYGVKIVPEKNSHLKRNQNINQKNGNVMPVIMPNIQNRANFQQNIQAAPNPINNRPMQNLNVDERNNTFIGNNMNSMLQNNKTINNTAINMTERKSELPNNIQKEIISGNNITEIKNDQNNLQNKTINNQAQNISKDPFGNTVVQNYDPFNNK